MAGPQKPAGRQATPPRPFGAGKRRAAVKLAHRLSAAALDPPAVVIDGGIIAGFGDSVGTVEFEDEPLEEYEQKKQPR